MKGSLRIAKIFNIPVEVHWSFLFLFVYVIYLAFKESWGVWGAVSASLFVLILFLCVVLHEFGHALHGMFSNVKYPYFSGTAVPRDFVEFPSQVNEMWSDNPAILKNYAKHYQNGSAMPQALLDKVIAASKFNQGFATTEYLGAAMLDQRWHQITADQVPDAAGVMKFEAAALTADGINYAPVPPRYKTPYFSHIMGGYSAGYYAYIWSEVLDANSVEWFKNNGGLKRENGDHFRKTLLSQGGSQDAMKLFRDFAGHDPKIEPLLEKRGLTTK